MEQINNARIYLDDVREAPKGYIRTRSVNETINIIKILEVKGIEIEAIDIDNDLGDWAKDGGDGIKLLDWLVERETFYPVKVHSMNVVAIENMNRMIERYWK